MVIYPVSVLLNPWLSVLGSNPKFSILGPITKNPQPKGDYNKNITTLRKLDTDAVPHHFLRRTSLENQRSKGRHKQIPKLWNSRYKN